MDPGTGKRLRMGRLQGPAGRGMIIAYSHGVLSGPLPGMETGEQMLHTACTLREADGIMITPGMVSRMEEAFIGRARPSLVLHLDWTNFSRKILPYEQGVQAPLFDVADAAAAGADAVMTYLLTGYDDPRQEAAEVERNARVSRACDRLGLVHVVEPRHALERRRPELKTDPGIMRLYCRMAAEIGADIVKSIWSGSEETMSALVESCPAPVYIAGGARAESEEAALQLARSAMRAGCRGLIFGRNVYQAADPASMLSKLREIVDAPQ